MRRSRTELGGVVKARLRASSLPTTTCTFNRKHPMQTTRPKGQSVPARPPLRTGYPDLSPAASVRRAPMHRPNRNDLPIEQLGWNLLDEQGDFVFPTDTERTQ